MSDGFDDAGLSATRAVCDMVRTTMGPFGMAKIIVERTGAVTTASSGVGVLEGVDIDDPYLTLLTDAAASFESEHIDGTASLVALTGALLERAVDLEADGIHPSTIERGYYEAFAVADEALEDYSRPVSDVGLAAVAQTAMTGVRDHVAARQFGDSVANAVQSLPLNDGSPSISDRIMVTSRTGGSHFETEVKRGVVLDERPVADNMPRRLSNTRVALLSSTVDMPKLGNNRQESDSFAVTVESAEDRAAIEGFERESFNQTLDRVLDLGCECVVTERAINDRVKAALSNRGILGLQRVDTAALSFISRATGSTVVPSLDDLDEETVGAADVSVHRKAGRDMVFVESEAGEPVRTLFCRSPDPRSAASFEHAVEGALSATGVARTSDSIVPGGGAIENAISHDVAHHARSTGGRRQLAAAAFADALTVVPRTLAENAGLDGMDALIDLRTAYDEDEYTVGIDAYTGSVTDIFAQDPVADATEIKRAVWSAATDLAVRLIRIDEQLSATDLGSDDSAERPIDR